LSEIIAGIKVIKHRYEMRGFTIGKWHVDNEFNKTIVEDAITPASLEPYARNEHVGPIEISIREIKQRTRCTCQGLPYIRLPKLMVRELLAGIMKMMNAVPNMNGISDTMSPGTMVDGRSKLDVSLKRINFGSYAFIHIDTNNTMKSRSVPGIALRPSNDNGGHYFLNLETNKRIHSYNWDELPTSDMAIKRVFSFPANIVFPH
jgi:hypothetical protein